MQVYLDFEKPIAELEGKIQELRVMSQDDPEVSILEEVTKLEAKVTEQLEKHIKNWTPGKKPKWRATLPVRISKIISKPLWKISRP